MSIVRCEICQISADLDYVDMVDMPGMKGFAHPDCLAANEFCPECDEHRPEDVRVKNEMRCGFCTYGYGEPISLAPATCADAEESSESEVN